MYTFEKTSVSMIKKKIPVHKLKTYTDLGIKLVYLAENQNDWSNIDIANMETHRDDYYVFIIMERCEVNITVDFKDFEIGNISIFYIAPGQVQSNFPEKNNMFFGWGIAIEPNLIDDIYRKVLTDNLLNQRSIKIEENELKSITQCLSILNNKLSVARDTPIDSKIIFSLLDAFLGMFAKRYQELQEVNINTNSRPFFITSEFRKLLSENFKTMKSPSQYAEILHISMPYLNQAVKKMTGFSVSHWILQENMLEAKRLLYHSNMNVKEIAFVLGYDDHTYFSRLFSNSNGESPLTFRKKYRE